MLVVRLTKVFMTAALAAFAAIVAYDNVVDYGSNYAFVQHVLSMDTTFPGNALMHRAILDETMWRNGYAVLIGGEALTAVLFIIGALLMLFSLNAPSRFSRAKVWVVAGTGVGFAIWFFGFMVVGGEYFAMWQSKTWNGQEAAFRFYMTMMVVAIFVSMGEDEFTGR